MYQTLMKEYMQKKFYYIAEDVIMLKESFEDICNTINETTSSDLNNSKIFHGSLIEEKIKDDDITGFTGNILLPWYVDEQDERYYGLWYYPKKDINDSNDETVKDNYNKVSIYQNLVEKFFRKYYGNKDKLYVTVEFITVSFHDGFFYKYPLANSDYTKNYNNSYFTFTSHKYTSFVNV